MKQLPKILIDARMVNKIPHGIARYVMNLAKALNDLNLDYYEPVFLVSPETPLSDFFSFKTIQAQSKFLSWKELFEIPKIIKDHSISAYHSPSFSSLIACPVPSIVTIHDLNHLHYGNFLNKIYYSIILRRFALKSSKVLSISEFSRNEIAKWLKIPQEKITIAYNAIEKKNKLSSDLVDQILKKFNLKPDQYFFCLSNSKPHKNLTLLQQAYLKFRSQQKNAYPLVSNSFIFQGEGIIFLKDLNDVEVQVLIEQSSGLFFPSLYEGFGLPPVEGAALGTPVVVSSIPPHREGLIDLLPYEAIWVSPNDIHGWTQAFHRIYNGEIKKISSATQDKILHRFSIKSLGETMDKIYKGLNL